MSGDNKAVFMQTVREALGYAGNIRRQAPSGLFPESPSDESLARLERIEARRQPDRRVLIERLLEAAEPINLDVRIVVSLEEAATAISEKVASSPTEWGGPRQVCAWEHPLIDSLDLSTALSARDVSFVSVGSFSPDSMGRVPIDERRALRRDVIDSFVGITAADFCVADTATLVMRTRPGRPRSVSLVPSIHIAVITADRILVDFKELYAALRWEDPAQPADLTTCMTFISGPSKTADIEATLVHGAHGPRTVCLYVISEESTRKT